METLTANLSGETRHATLQGRDCLVVPVSLIVPGVLNGNRGPILYTGDENAKSVSAWNGMPIVLGHPLDGEGNEITARSADVLNKAGMGVILNTNSNGKLAAEAWLDIQNTKRLAPTVLADAEAGRKVEVSTGLRMTVMAATENAEHEGTPFVGTATDLRPDHLAILTNAKGACSVEDGCGINNQTSEATAMTEQEKTALIDEIIANCETCDDGDREELATLNDDQLTKWSERVKASASKTAELVANQKALEDKVKAAEAKSADDKTVTNALTAEQEADIEFAGKIRQERRDKDTATVLANEANELTAEDLEAMTPGMLRRTANSQPKKPATSYVGAEGSDTLTANAEEDFPPFGSPHEYIPLSDSA